MIAESFHTDTSFITTSVYSAPQDQCDVKTDFKVAHTGPIAHSGRCYQVLLASIFLDHSSEVKDVYASCNNALG